MLLHYRVCHNIFSERSLHNGFNLLGFIGQKNKNLICGSDNISVIAVFIFQLFAVINRGFHTKHGKLCFLFLFIVKSESADNENRIQFFESVCKFISELFGIGCKAGFDEFKVKLGKRIFAKLFRKTRFCEQRKIQACNSFSVLLLCVCVFGFQRCLEFWCNAQISRYLCIVIGGVPPLKGVGIILITRFFSVRS